MQAHVVTAPGDGIAPAVLLSLPASGGGGGGGAAAAARQPPAQYLFNVPEGFARLVLEHKLRPGAGLRAAFAPNPTALSGFGGLVMRLRGEGHSQLHVVGPPGTQAAVCGLRHFIHWRHPAVVLEEASPWEAPLLYQDDRIAVAALWKPPLLAAMWPAPAWLQQAQTEGDSQPAAARPGGSDGSSSSSSSGGSEESSSSEKSSSSSEKSSSSSEESSSSSSSEESESEESSSGGSGSDQPPQQQHAPGAAPSKDGMFDALDKLFMSGQGSRRLALDQLKQATAEGAAGPATAAGPAGGRPAPKRTLAAGASAPRKPAAVTGAMAAAAAKAAAAVAAPTRRRHPVVAPADAGEADDVAVIAGKRFQRLPAQAGINVWVCQKLASKAAVPGPAANGSVGSGLVQPLPSRQQQQQQQAGGWRQGQQQGQLSGQHGQQHAQQQMLGFVCHLRGSDQLLLLTNLHSRAAAAQLQQHPALALLAQQPERVAAVLHLAAPGVAGSRALRQLCQQLRPAVQGPAAGQQLLLEQPGAHGSGQVIGHLAAARTTAKLNLVSSRLFPLPAGVRAPQQAAAMPAAAAAVAEAAGPPSPRTDVAGEQAAAVQPEAAGCNKAAPDEPTRPEAGSGSPGRAEPAGAGAQPGAASSSGLVHVQQLSVLTWRQQETQQPSTATADAVAAATTGSSAQEPQLRLAVEPAEGLAATSDGGFDAAAVQQEVQGERPQLAAQLALLREQAQRGELPGSDQLEWVGLPAWQCRQNCVAPPPPPPMSPAQLAQPVQQHGWQQPVPVAMQQHAWQQAWLAVAGQPQLAPQQQAVQVPLPLPLQQQAWQQPPPPPPQQQGCIMRPLYHHQQSPAALPAASQQAQYYHMQQQLAMQPQAWQPAAGMVLMPRPPPPPPPGEPPSQLPEPGQPEAQQQQDGAQQHPGPDNKRAAGDLKARLQGAKRQRQDDSGPSGAGAAAGDGADGADEAMQLRQGDTACASTEDEHKQQPPPAQRQPWLEGAPPGIRQLASRQHGSSKGSSGGSKGSSGSGPEVLFLGTGSAEPSKYRGASAIQLRLSCGQSLLLDCGEGTLGALCRAHGTPAALRQVASLGCLWVSHRHADHMSGVLPLLAAYPASLPPLLVVGPRSLRDWLAEAAGPLGLAGRYLFVHCAQINQPGHWARQALQRHLGVTDVQCVPVRHCSDAYGLALRHEEGWSLVYSGDTQPCQQLVQAGRGCSLLIHEATFEPCLEQQARAKRHSTTAEALDIAQRMGAYRCILTHFSQRYPKWPEGLPLAAAPDAAAAAPAAGEGSDPGSRAMPAAAGGGTAAVAFDGMRVPLALLPVLPALMPAVQAALADVEEEAREEGEQQGQQQQAEQVAQQPAQAADDVKLDT